ncbi:MAG: hypothetical protein ABIG34_02145 [Candidatus Peregrinibacteria bacterium]
MEPLFQTSLMGFSVTVYPDRVTYRKMWAGEQSVPLSQIASVTVAMMGVQRVTIETTGGKKIKMPVALSDKDKLRDAIFAAQSGTKSQHVTGAPQSEAKVKKGAKPEMVQERGRGGLRRVLAWVIGVFFVLAALGTLGTHPAAALAFLVAAGVTLPPSSRYLQTKITFLSRSGMRITVAAVAFFVAVGLQGSVEQRPNAAQPQKEAQTTSAAVLAQHKVLPEGIHGTTRIIHVIVQPTITETEIVAINDSLISKYARGLTHLNIEYFDDEAIAADYFQRLSQVSETEGDKMFKHYIGTYTMNKTTGYNKLGFHVGDGWVTIKEY